MSDLFIGANVGELHNLANDLENTQAVTIDGVVTAVQGMIDSLDAIWRGTDATSFAGEWASTHRPALETAATALRTAAANAHRNADTQDSTSSVM